MSTFLLTWNPKRWTWSSLVEDAAGVASGARIARTWSTGVTRRILPGDRLFLLRQGPEPRGIMASGFATQPVTARPHYDPDRRENGDTAFMTEVEFDTLVVPENEGVLPLSVLKEEAFNYHWEPAASGPSIPPDVARVVERLWAGHMRTTDRGRPLHEDGDATYREGSRIVSNGHRFERDPAARAACLSHHGAVCQACGFDFGARYGALGEGFIHVHHREPLYNIGDEHVVDPVRDLVPVCANCHAMLHRTRPPLSVERLREILEEAAG